MSNKNPQHINDLLVKIGMVKNGKPLATLRDYGQQGKHYDLVLHTDPESAANLVEKKLGIEANHYDDDGSYYWDFTIENEWEFCFEQYRSGSEYMTITDLRPAVEEKPPVVSILDISNSYQALKAEFTQKEADLAKQFKDNFESQMVELLEQVHPIKAVVWVQYSKWDDGAHYGFNVYDPSFLSFIPEEIKQHYSNNDLPHSDDFNLVEHNVKTSKKLNSIEQDICIKMCKIITQNNGLFEQIFDNNQCFCLTADGLEIEDYDYNE